MLPHCAASTQHSHTVQDPTRGAAAQQLCKRTASLHNSRYQPTSGTRLNDNAWRTLAQINLPNPKAFYFPPSSIAPIMTTGPNTMPAAIAAALRASTASAARSSSLATYTRRRSAERLQGARRAVIPAILCALSRTCTPCRECDTSSVYEIQCADPASRYLLTPT